MQYRLPIANQEVSDANHFGSVSDSLGRLNAWLVIHKHIAFYLIRL